MDAKGDISTSKLPNNIDDKAENPLVTVGIVPSALADIFRPVPEMKKHTMKIGRRRTPKARVLTSEDIASDIRKQEEAKQKLAADKEWRKQERIRKKEQRLQEQNLKRQAKKENKKRVNKKSQNSTLHSKKSVKRKFNPGSKMSRKSLQNDVSMFEDIHDKMKKCTTFAELEQLCQHILQLLPISHDIPGDLDENLQVDEQSSELLREANIFSLEALSVVADGNCLSRCASILLYNSHEKHVEMRVRIIVELVVHKDTYLDDSFLEKSFGPSSQTPCHLSTTYAMFSDQYIPGSKLLSSDINQLYEKEVMAILMPASYMGIWQMHAISSVIGVPIQSVYPGKGFVQATLNRTIFPRSEANQEFHCLRHIMWTTVDPVNPGCKWFQPNHFVVLRPTIPNEEDQPQVCIMYY